MEESVCPLCNRRLIVVDDELVCDACGYVVQDTNIISSEFGQKKHLTNLEAK